MHNIEASLPKLARDTCITNGILYDQCVDIAVQKVQHYVLNYIIGTIINTYILFTSVCRYTYAKWQVLPHC